ncbi:MAG: hypothetical protein DI551_07350 [Micavibrio aeruginosavorus]|uniref:Formyl transferase N-terminal domain-containing protein n=1 Tax=Micavibrio aeruginosavorus TaxID=349221 RepID=A0A2W5MW36_9BACT|nr:MAG: hypothetical protein DI551_07350 [Micavibrio aeruginosavorus]
MNTARKKIALFVGSDVTAQIVLNRLIDDMVDKYEPIIFLPTYPNSPKAQLPELKRFSFYDRHLLNDTVYPYIETRRIYAPNRSPSIIAHDHGIRVETVANVNDPEFIEELRNEPNLAGAISIRSFQIFKQPLIDILHDKGFFLNLHPGILPQYRGVMSTFRMMAAGETSYGWTLHKVAEEIDAGEILWMKARPLDPSKSGYALNINMAAIGAQSVMQALKEVELGNVLIGSSQKARQSRYYTYPTESELKSWQKKGIHLIDPDEVINTLVERFSQPGTSHAYELTEQLNIAVRDWEVANNAAPIPETEDSKLRNHFLSSHKGIVKPLQARAAGLTERIASSFKDEGSAPAASVR